MGFVMEAGLFIIQVVFGLVILLVLMRFLLQTVRADFNNPFSQTLYRLTSPLVKPFRRFVPGYKGIDIALLVLLLLLQFLEVVLISALVLGVFPWTALVLLSLFALITFTLWVYLVAIIILVLVSFIQPGGYNPVVALIYQLTNPLMQPFRSRMAKVGGMDFSPLVVTVLLTLLVMAVKHLKFYLLGLLFPGDAAVAILARLL